MRPVTAEHRAVPPRLDVLFGREDSLFAKGLLWAALISASWLSIEVDLDYADLPKDDFVSVLAWLFPSGDWGTALPLWYGRLLLWLGGPLWLLGPASTRRLAAWAAVGGMLLIGSSCWENLPFFLHKYVPPFWILLVLALGEQASDDPAWAPRWVRHGAVFVLALFYGGAGIAKLVESGWAWGDGVSLQLWFWRLGDESAWLQQLVVGSAGAARFFATGALLLELATFLAIPFRALRPFLAVGLILMHLGVEQVLGIDFRNTILLVAAILLPWDRLVRLAVPILAEGSTASDEGGQRENFLHRFSENETPFE